MSGSAPRPSDESIQDLLRVAFAAAELAHSPYSKVRVGAALVGGDGQVYSGCNVENASYGLALCAERSAVAHLVAAGASRVVAVAVVTAGPEPGRPCGMCRQTLSEFADDDLLIGLAVEGDALPRAVDRLGDIFAHPFRGDLVKKS